MLLAALLSSCSESPSPLLGEWVAQPPESASSKEPWLITFKDDGTFTFSPDPNKTGGAGTWNVTADTPEAGFDGVFVFKVTNTTTSTTCSYKANETTMTFGGCSLQNLTFTRKT